MVICVLIFANSTQEPHRTSPARAFCRTPIAQSYKIANKLRNFFQP